MLISKSAPQKRSKTGRYWVLPEASERDILYLRQNYEISEIAARLAMHRMSSLEEAEEIFLPSLKTHLPDPSYLPDSEKAFAFVHEQLCQQKPLAVWGDYDVDGACSAALLVRYFHSLGISAVPYVPDRFQEGYGPNQTGLETLRAQGRETIFIVDCGTTAFAPLAWAKTQGLNIIIIDHHRVASQSPDCYAFINPKRLDYTGPKVLQTLCAGGLVFLFLVGLNRYLRQKGYFEHHKEPDLLSLLDLVALSTICDMMPLRKINRVFVKQGLKVMRQRQNIGLTALIDASGIKEIPNPTHLGYTIGPRINAGGRIGDASLGVRLLSSHDPEQALKMAQELTLLNQERQQIERQVEEEAHHQARLQHQSPFLFVKGDSWHEGVLGIIASHLKETYYKPTFVLTAKNEYLKGSVRSIPGVDVGELIHQACEHNLLVTGGGHPMAGGLTIHHHTVPAFFQFIEQFFLQNKPEDTQPPLVVDMGLTFQNLQDPEFFKALELLGPFGADYPQPRFLFSQIRLENITPFGYNHLRMRAVQMDGRRHPLVYFRSADKDIGRWLLQKTSHIVDCVFTVQIDYRWGYRKAHLMLEDLR